MLKVYFTLLVLTEFLFRKYILNYVMSICFLVLHLEWKLLRKPAASRCNLLIQTEHVLWKLKI
jgi:hypothetical protein